MSTLREKCPGVFSGPYFPIYGLNTGKYGPEKTPYLNTFHVVPGYLKAATYTNTDQTRFWNEQKNLWNIIYL